jgi:hypothetical protein
MDHTWTTPRILWTLLLIAMLIWLLNCAAPA